MLWVLGSYVGDPPIKAAWGQSRVFQDGRFMWGLISVVFRKKTLALL